jgi:hypothetical protein
MSYKKAKIFLINNELTVSEIARKIAPDDETLQKSYRVMITDMINGRRFYPSLADKVFDAVGLRLERPAHLRPFPTRQAA